MCAKLTPAVCTVNISKYVLLNIYDLRPQKFNLAPEKWWLEDYFPIGKVTFQGLC